MPVARIYRPSRTATQQGLANTRHWLLEYEQLKPRTIEPLMGWTSSSDMRQQLRLTFDTKEEAVAFAERHAIPYRVLEPEKPRRRKKAYADNFRYDRVS